MAGPWEQYQQASDGPWTQYATQEGPAADFAKSVPHGFMSGISSALSAAGQSAAHEMSQPDLAAEIPNAPTTQKILEQQITGETHTPQGRAGRFGAAIGEGLGNPLTYAGPGTLPLKLGGSVLSSVGGEAGKQAAAGTPLEIPATIAGGLVGGAAAAKTLGPTMEKAAVPSIQELKASAQKGYDAAKASGLELSPQGVSQFASQVEQDLMNTHAHTGGQYGTAPKTIDILNTLQSAPAGAIITAANLDTIRKNLGRVAGETKDFRPTPDAQAATVALEHLKNYTENIPANHVMAGDPQAYVRAVKQANADYAAMARSRTIDTKLTRAENNAQGGIATSPDNQIKSQLRQILNNPKAQRGYSPEELSAMQGVNDGTAASNILRQLGRGGSGVIPLSMHAAAAAPAALATGGMSLPIQIALGLGLYGAKKTAEGMTKRSANALDEMIRMRSPEFQKRLAGTPAPDYTQNAAAIIRGLLSARF